MRTESAKRSEVSSIEEVMGEGIEHEIKEGKVKRSTEDREH